MKYSQSHQPLIGCSEKGGGVNNKRYKVMAYILSSGIWDAFGPITLEKVLGERDRELEAELKRWQSLYDDQFKTYTYGFNWERFNEEGEKLVERIRGKLRSDAEIYYEPSDDREFFSPDECDSTCNKVKSGLNLKTDKLERKRSMLYAHIAGGF